MLEGARIENQHLRRKSRNHTTPSKFLFIAFAFKFKFEERGKSVLSLQVLVLNSLKYCSVIQLEKSC